MLMFLIEKDPSTQTFFRAPQTIFRYERQLKQTAIY